MFCGDAIHSPAQVFHPEWSSGFCFDREQAVADAPDRCCNAPSARDCGCMPAHLRGTSMRIEEKNGGFVPVIEP